MHRAVWAPSRLTEERYRRVTRTWPYRSDLDCVVEAPDGTFAAYVLCWYDDDNRVGEFEPVGTHPDYRRRGLGAAVCRYALKRLREEGARRRSCYTGERDEDERSRGLYDSVGFRRHYTRHPAAKGTPVMVAVLQGLIDLLTGSLWTYPLLFGICAGDALIPAFPVRRR